MLPSNHDQEELFAPSQESQRKVLDWLAGAGIDTDSVRLRKAGANMEFSASISQMEDLLKTKYHVARDVRTGAQELRSAEHTIPEELQEHVHFVTAVSTPPGKLKKRRHRSQPRDSQPRAVPVALDLDVQEPKDLSNCSLSWTPECIRGKFRSLRAGEHCWAF
jgi:hypothetical protein